MAFAAFVSVTYEMHVDLASVAIANANVSARGAIRAAHDVIAWASKLLLLMKQGLSNEMVAQRFNAQASQKAALTGARLQSITALLQPQCHEGVTKMLSLVSEVGPEQGFWDEHAWANKRLMPGYVPRSGNKLWQENLKVTPESFTTMVHALCVQQKQRAPHLRTKLHKRSLEEFANLASMLVWLCASCLRTEPAMHKATAEYQEGFVNGNHDITLDLQGCTP